MDHRFYEDLHIALSSYYRANDYDEEGEDTEEEYEGEEVNNEEISEKSDELACPFCLEDFDVLGFFCHIDVDHRMEIKPGICPLCSTKVGTGMASHVITQHESILKALCHKKNCSARSQSAILLLRKELQEKHLRSIKEAVFAGSSTNAVADSKLMSFVNIPQPPYRPQTTVTDVPTEARLSEKSSDSDTSERKAVSTDGQSLRSNSSRCEFLQELLVSTIIDDF